MDLNEQTEDSKSEATGAASQEEEEYNREFLSMLDWMKQYI